MIKRAATPIVAALVVAGCASASASSSAEHVGRPTATTSPHAAPKESRPVPVAIPACTSPEVRPDFWTPYCGDAGYQLTDLSWDAWTARSARAHGAALITHGDLAGQRWKIWVLFDRPRHVTGFKPRQLFARAVVHYIDRPGPSGRWIEVLPLRGVWETARFIAHEG